MKLFGFFKKEKQVEHITNATFVKQDMYVMVVENLIL